MWTEFFSFQPVAVSLLAAAAGSTEGGHDFSLAWFDFLVVIVVLLGIRTGKKRGLSEELLEVTQWMVVVGGCALGYMPIGKLLAKQTHLSLFFSYLLAYVLVTIVVCLSFTGIKRLVGDKLVESDYFGRFEYTGGMLAATVRFLCIMTAALALLNARFYTPAQREAIRRANIQDTGIALVPTLSGFQQDILLDSYTGKFVKDKLGFLLITPTAYNPQQLREEGMGKKTEKQLDEVFSTPKKEAPKTAPKKE